MFQIGYNQVHKEGLKIMQAILDSDVSIDVTYRYRTNPPQSGTTEPPGTEPDYDLYSITVVNSNTALEAQAASTVGAMIGFESGEQQFITRYDELPRDPQSKNITYDYIIINGSTRQIKKALPIFDVLVKIRV